MGDRRDAAMPPLWQGEGLPRRRLGGGGLPHGRLMLAESLTWCRNIMSKADLVAEPGPARYMPTDCSEVWIAAEGWRTMGQRLGSAVARRDQGYRNDAFSGNGSLVVREPRPTSAGIGPVASEW
jgi:hypothetical protein